MPRADAIKRKSLRFVPLPRDEGLVTGEYSVAIIRSHVHLCSHGCAPLQPDAGCGKALHLRTAQGVRTTMTPQSIRESHDSRIRQ